MSSKANVWRVVHDHFATLKDHNTRKVRLWDIVFFFIIPLPLAFLLEQFRSLGPGDAEGIIVTSLSVFAALLFNLLLLVYDLVSKADRDASNHRKKLDLLNQLFANVSFSILTSILSIVSVMTLSLDLVGGLAQVALGVFAYYLIIVFMLTLFMVLKRAHILLSVELETSS